MRTRPVCGPLYTVVGGKPTPPPWTFLLDPVQPPVIAIVYTVSFARNVFILEAYNCDRH